ncbi:MAG TPA: SAM-dependent methyltransferase [Gammaproteobacteria bacterium]|uniref:class I SAM-dependent methyltransferase n=1 Tax=Immundisolibacter sp. TaxID=1934948 RepID=UPI000E8D2262|nr:SAM-dependent methyltransferase [Gammaproteobacteria bacterium]HCZ48945.1 SAM-dependent methyltransferase [Gammaproteobacteria bacterium]MCH78383.1 SAM-dependent methyltransferase [Gammaproteobacteria bacterium]
MTTADADRWEARYRSGTAAYAAQPAPFVQHWLPRLPRGRALDVACGLGATAIALAEAGFAVTGIDIAPTALARAREHADRRGVRVDWQCADLADHRLPADHYDLIVNIHYVNRDLLAQFADALRPGGWLLFEQHLRWPEPVAGPASDHYRLRTNELRHLLWQLQLVHYEEGLCDAAGSDRPLALARAAARRPG